MQNPKFIPRSDRSLTTFGDIVVPEAYRHEGPNDLLRRYNHPNQNVAYAEGLVFVNAYDEGWKQIEYDNHLADRFIKRPQPQPSRTKEDKNLKSASSLDLAKKWTPIMKPTNIKLTFPSPPIDRTALRTPSQIRNDSKLANVLNNEALPQINLNVPQAPTVPALTSPTPGPASNAPALSASAPGPVPNIPVVVQIPEVITFTPTTPVSVLNVLVPTNAPAAVAPPIKGSRPLLPEEELKATLALKAAIK